MHVSRARNAISRGASKSLATYRAVSSCAIDLLAAAAAENGATKRADRYASILSLVLFHFTTVER